MEIYHYGQVTLEHYIEVSVWDMDSKERIESQTYLKDDTIKNNATIDR